MMSLLEKASIITTPTAYDDGKLLSVKPVQTFGSELITNGSFDTDSDWSKSNATISDGKGNLDGDGQTSLLWQDILTNGKTYKATFTVFDYNELGEARVIDNSGSVLYTITSNGTFTINFTHSIANGLFIFRARSGAVLSIDNVSVKEVIDADFSFQRGSSATRVNEQGLVQDVQILSDELVQNGNFEEIGSEEVSNGDFEQIGSELVVNGDFATDSDWTKQLNWTIANGSANSNGTGLIYQTSVSYVDGKTYKVTFDASITSGTGTVRLGNTTSPTPFTNGANEFYLQTDASNTTKYIFFQGNSLVGSIDNVSVKEVGQDWEFTDGATITDNGVRIVSDGTLQKITQNNILTVGKQYKIQYEILENNSGELKMSSSFGLTPIPSTVGTHTVYAEALQTFLSILRVSTCDITITNLSVKEVGQNWTFGTGWSVGDGKASCDGTGGLTTQNIIDQNKTYLVSFDVVNYTSGDIRSVFSADAATYSENINSVGTYTRFVTSSTTSGKLQFFPNPSFNGSIDNVSVVEITDDTDLPRINYTNFDYQDVLGDELVTNGSFDTDSNWSKGTGWSISDGKASCDGSQVSGTQLYQTPITFTNSKTYKVVFTCTIESGNLDARLQGSGATVTGDAVTTSGTYTQYLVSTGNTSFRMRGNTDFIGSIDNVSVKEFTEDVLVPYSGEGSLLLEPQSTNLLPYSEDFSNVYWGKTSVTVSTSTITDPTGGQNSFKLVPDSGTGGNRSLSRNFTGLSGLHTQTVFAKKGEYNYIMLRTRNSPNTAVMFDLENGTFNVNLTSAAFDSAKIEDYGNDWFRCSMTLDPSQMTTSGRIYTSFSVGITGSEDNSFNGDGTSGIYVFGAQFEEQSFSTSYIPTEGSTKTRLQDICNNAGSSDLINSTEGVIYAEISALDLSNYLRELSISDGTISNRIQLRYYDTSDNKIQSLVVVGGSTQASALITLSNAKEFNKIAFLYKQNDFRLFVNGIKVFTDTSGSTFSANTLSELSFDRGGGGNPFYGNVKCVAVFKEALSDEELACLTS